MMDKIAAMIPPPKASGKSEADGNSDDDWDKSTTMP